MVIYALVRVGETRLRKVSNSTSSISLESRATDSFRELVGCLMWLANHTRLDIANAVRAVAKNMNTPRKVHSKTKVGIFAFIRIS